ncbi:MAG: hypothetical protein Q7S14_02570 [bacterium]|nr:hypothetical protein [bacterium]
MSFWITPESVINYMRTEGARRRRVAPFDDTKKLIDHIIWQRAQKGELTENQDIQEYDRAFEDLQGLFIENPTAFNELAKLAQKIQKKPDPSQKALDYFDSLWKRYR